jgi:tetratricopeptide (TPR) repeat protein
MELVLERALRHADIAGEHPQRSRILRDLARATVIGPRPVPEGVTRCQEILERAGDDVPLRAVAETMLGVLEAMGGDFDTARQRSLTARRRLEDVGLTVTAVVLRMYRAFVEGLAGTPQFAIPDLVEACTLLEKVGERRRLATTAALLARLLYAAERHEEAEHFSQVTEATASKDDVVSLVVWKGTLGRLAARAGRVPEALRLADAAVDLAAKTDFVILRADALAERAEVLTLTGRSDRAARAWVGAIALYERKGSTAAVARVRAASGLTPALPEPLP